jgi:mycothiol synthase
MVEHTAMLRYMNSLDRTSVRPAGVFIGGYMAQIPSESFLVRSPTLDDAEAIADLINACSVEHGEKPSATEQSIRTSMKMPGLDLETDTLLAIDRRRRVIGFALVQDNPPNALLSALAEVHPQQRGKGIGTVLCRWIEERARQAISRLPTGTRVAVVQKRSSHDKTARDLLSEEGYQVVRHNFRMVIEMDAPPAEPMEPEGIVIRPFNREEEGRALVEALRDAFRDNWGYVERPFELEYQRWMHILGRDDDGETARYWFVAIDEKEIVGFALSRLRESQDLGDALIYVVGVRPGWRRRGIALALLERSFRELYQAGKRRVRLEVDAQNRTGATRLYEKAGMRVERRYDFWEKELCSGKN